MDNSGMTRMLRENLFEYGGSAHVGCEIAALFGGPENRERIESGGVDVVGKLAVKFGEHGLMTSVTLLFSAFAKKDFDTLKIEPFALWRRFGKKGVRCRRQPFQNLAARSDIWKYSAASSYSKL